MADRFNKLIRPSLMDSFYLDEEEDDESMLEIEEERLIVLRNKIKISIERALTMKNITNAMFILSISFICIEQCYVQVNNYLKYPEHIQVTHSFPTSSLWMIPGLTICNNARVRFDRLVRRMPIEDASKFTYKLNKATNGSGEAGLAIMSKRKRFEIMKMLKETVDTSINVTSLLIDSPLETLMELSSSNVIKDVNCNGLWGKQFNCENFAIIESYQAGSCYTLFYFGSVLEALATGRAYDFNTSSLGGQRKVGPFESHEIVEIFVDFEPLQDADFQRDLGGKLIVHANAHIGSVRDLIHSIVPGHSYDFIIQRVMLRRLPPPYPSMCFDYKVNNSYLFTKMSGSHPSSKLDRVSCQRSCLVKRVTATCNCWPIEVPYFSGDPLVNNSDTFKMCPWGHDESDSRSSGALYLDCFKKNYEHCRRTCPPSCRSEEYKVHMISNPWPSRDMFFSAKDEAEQKALLRLEGCCARISIKYANYMETRHIMQPSMTFVSMVSNLGGIVSGLVGMSTVTIYRFITRRIFHCRVVREDHDQTLMQAKKDRIRRLALIGAKFFQPASKIACRHRVSPTGRHITTSGQTH